MSALEDAPLTVVLTAEQADAARRALVKSSATALQVAAGQFMELAKAGVTDEAEYAVARGLLRTVGHELEARDALGRNRHPTGSSELIAALERSLADARDEAA